VHISRLDNHILVVDPHKKWRPGYIAKVQKYKESIF